MEEEYIPFNFQVNKPLEKSEVDRIIERGFVDCRVEEKFKGSFGTHINTLNKKNLLEKYPNEEVDIKQYLYSIFVKNFYTFDIVIAKFYVKLPCIRYKIIEYIKSIDPPIIHKDFPFRIFSTVLMSSINNIKDKKFFSIFLSKLWKKIILMIKI